MTDIDLAAIEARHRLVQYVADNAYLVLEPVVASCADVPVLVAEVRQLRESLGMAAVDVEAADKDRAALARVRALHVPEWVVVDYVGGSVCRECREPVESEPCATIRALDGAS